MKGKVWKGGAQLLFPENVIIRRLSSGIPTVLETFAPILTEKRRIYIVITLLQWIEMIDMIEKEDPVISEEEAAQYDRQIRLWGLDAQKRFVSLFSSSG